MSNLRLINETEITSTVTSVDVDNIFSADFDIYKIVLDGVQESSSGNHQWVRMRFINSSGSIISASEYDYAHLRMIASSAFAEEKNTNQDNILYAGLGYTDDYGTNAVAYIFNPYSSSSYTFALGQSSFTAGASNQNAKGIGVHKSTETIRGIRFYQSSGSMGSGFIRIYGLRVDT
jgi:hypothetical protein